ncbi:MAG: carboxylesterase family protein [Burkholderiales bacterium]|nr:carboxylesterase family protein [Burkholderiales bacterium]
MTQKNQGPRSWRRRAGLISAMTVGLVAQFGCSSDEPVYTGNFVGSAVSGLDYRTNTLSGTTDAAGAYSYLDKETVSFSIGNLALGSATAAEKLNAQTITAGAATAADQAVNNKLILLQTLDADGDLNNGIQITPEIRSIVSARAASINFSQSTTAFRTSLTELLTALNAAPVFTDTDPRARTARTAAAALEHFQRATAERNTVAIATGQISGYAATPTTWQYLGIPYAKPPLGDLRWKAPQAPVAWTGVRDAIAWGDQAPQNPSYQAFGEGGMSEDCLYLNVTAPKNASNLPVMVWFHGGGFVILTGNTKAFNNAASLPTKGVVLVTVTHRLGPIGYLAHPLLSAESGYGASGNYGQMDLVAALNWVKANITKFGGDPGNVTIFGESGGGGKVLSLMNSPLAKGLFHKGISQSGQAEMSNEILNVPPLAKAHAVGSSLFSRLGVTTLAQARAKPWTDIINAEIAAYPNGDYKDAYGPNLDGHYATKTMLDSIKGGLPNDVPLLQGSNNGDMPGLIVGMLEQAPLRATYNKAPQYVYKFTKMPAGWASKGLLSYHGGELVYVFNYQPSLISHFLLGLVMDPATGQRLAVGDLNGNGVTGTAGDAADVLASAGWGAADTAVADTMMTIWTNFAKTGNPSTAAFTWPAYTPANDTYVEIGTGLEKKTGLATAFK